ncbi:MAG TPA: polysaccharide deacetylase family protein [Terrimicrobiaceae bacterium]
METRHLLLAGRLGAILGILTTRGWPRALSWATHDFLWLYPTLRRNCAWHGEVVTRFQTNERSVWLTIDDGPDESDTPEILNLLARYGAKATFFVIGRKVEQNPALCRRMTAEGHTLGNHTYSHPSGFWWALPRPFLRREVERGSQAILSATGQSPRFFRSPVGMNNFGVHPVAADLGLRVVGWSADGCDGCPAAPTVTATRIMRTTTPGAIVLAHESGGSRHRVLTIARILEKLREAEYHFVIPPETMLR